jgi:hypothetical protein
MQARIRPFFIDVLHPLQSAAALNIACGANRFKRELERISRQHSHLLIWRMARSPVSATIGPAHPEILLPARALLPSVSAMNREAGTFLATWAFIRIDLSFGGKPVLDEPIGL